LVLAVLGPSVILHEIAHGWVALAFGDDTAKRAGRLTLNPIAHIDPFGSVILPLLLALTGAAPFGWAKPVPVNPSRLRSPRNQSVLVSLAGPATNIVIAVAAGLAIRRLGLGTNGWPARIVFSFGYLNVILAAFNLIPLPPLDGSAVIERFIPRAWWPRWAQLRQYSMGLILIVVLVLPSFTRGHSPLGSLFNTALHLWGHLL
jgi:Zn-dependent protease